MLKGTGPNGRIIVRDLESAAEGNILRQPKPLPVTALKTAYDAFTQFQGAAPHWRI